MAKTDIENTQDTNAIGVVCGALVRQGEALEVATLNSLTPAELDHVNVGLEHSFGLSIEPVDEYPGLFVIEQIGMSGDCTVMDAWRVAEAGEKCGHLTGLTNVLPN